MRTIAIACKLCKLWESLDNLDSRSLRPSTVEGFVVCSWALGLSIGSDFEGVVHHGGEIKAAGVAAVTLYPVRLSSPLGLVYAMSSTAVAALETDENTDRKRKGSGSH